VTEHLPMWYVISVASMDILSPNAIPTPPSARAVLDRIKLIKPLRTQVEEAVVTTVVDLVVDAVVDVVVLYNVSSAVVRIH
jgi:hypothetical protein